MIFSAVLLAVLLVAGGLWYTRPRTFWEAAGLDPEAVTGVAGTVIEYGFQNGRPYSQSRQMENRSPGQAEFDALMSQLDEMQFRGTLLNLLPLPSSYATDASTPSTILILADFLTIRERLGRLQGVNFVYFGDARYNMGNSLMVGCAKMGLHFTACAPKKYWPDPALIAQCQAIAAQTGATLRFEEDPLTAAKRADVLYTDVWVSMGEPVEVWAERIADLAPYQINAALMAAAGPQAVFMHCLPAFHDHKTAIGKEMGERFARDAMEVTDEVFEGPQSIVFDEAENRMHTIKAVMAATLGYTGE